MAEQSSDAVEWDVPTLERIMAAAVERKDFQGLRAALTLLAVKDPRRAEQWRQTLLLAVDVRAEALAAEADRG